MANLLLVVYILLYQCSIFNCVYSVRPGYILLVNPAHWYSFYYSIHIYMQHVIQDFFVLVGNCGQSMC